MSDNRSQDDADLPWPVARGELDDLETLELVRDATGRLAWQNIRPPAPETYRDWLPTRATKGTPPPPLPHDVADVGLDDPLAGLFDSEATSRVAREPLQPLDTPTASALEARVEPSRRTCSASSTEPLPELPLQAQSVSTVRRSALDRVASCPTLCLRRPLSRSRVQSGRFDTILADRRHCPAAPVHGDRTDRGPATVAHLVAAGRTADAQQGGTTGTPRDRSADRRHGDHRPRRGVATGRTPGASRSRAVVARPACSDPRAVGRAGSARCATRDRRSPGGATRCS